MLGAAEYQQKAPPKSYINVLDYESPKELAEFLLKLAADEEEYLSYFWWKVGASQSVSGVLALLCFRDITRSTRTRGRGRGRRCASSVRSWTSLLCQWNPTPVWGPGGGLQLTALGRVTFPGPDHAPPGPVTSSSSFLGDNNRLALPWLWTKQFTKEITRRTNDRNKKFSSA